MLVPRSFIFTTLEVLSCIMAHSPQTRVQFCSSPDRTECGTVAGTPWRNCDGSRELLSGIKSWGESVSFVLQNEKKKNRGRRRVGWSRRLRRWNLTKKETGEEKEPRKCHRSESAVEVQRFELRSRRRRARLIVRGLSPGTSPSLSPRFAEWSGSLPPRRRTNGAAARLTGYKSCAQLAASAAAVSRSLRRRHSYKAAGLRHPHSSRRQNRSRTQRHVRTVWSRCCQFEANLRRKPEVTLSLTSLWLLIVIYCPVITLKKKKKTDLKIKTEIWEIDGFGQVYIHRRH